MSTMTMYQEPAAAAIRTVRAETQSDDSEHTSEPSSRHSNHPVLATYIREVSKEPLLNREEEILLFAALREARLMAQSVLLELNTNLTKTQSAHLRANTLRYEELSAIWDELTAEVKTLLRREQTATLHRALNSWRAAREQLLKANLRLVIYTVKRYRNDASLFMDLIQEGNIGLMRAIDRYDPALSSKFSTYALYWIWQAVNRAYAKNVYTVRIPVYKVQQVGRYHRKRRALAADLDRNPSDEEIAEAVGLSAREVQQVTDLQANSISLDDASGDDSLALSEYLTSPDASPEEDAMRGDMGHTLREALETLPPREAQALRWRYGIDSETLTLQEIGSKLGVSRERVRQLEQQAINRLLRSDFAETLRDYRA